jgi:hypothetical protein
MNPMYAWEQTVDDGRFRCWVTQDEGEGYSGVLHVEEVANGTPILEEKVGIAYAARFGPDVDDVTTWQAKSISAIDAWIANNEGETNE